MNQAAFTDLSSADVAMLELVRSVADSRGWDPQDLADAEEDLSAAYEESEGLIWDDLPGYWSALAVYVSAWPMDGADKILAVVSSASATTEAEEDEEYLGSYAGTVVGTVTESAADVSEAASVTGTAVKAASESSYTGPVLLLIAGIALVLVVRR